MSSPPVREALLDDLREAFASGDAVRGEALLAASLDADLAWDHLTRAVAEGVARRYGALSSRPPTLNPAVGVGLRARLGRAIRARRVGVAEAPGGPADRWPAR